MPDSYKIITMVKATLQRPNDQVGRPMSLRLVFVVWLILVLISGYGAYDFYYG